MEKIESAYMVVTDEKLVFNKLVGPFKAYRASEVDAEFKLMQQSYEANKQGREADFKAYRQAVKALVESIRTMKIPEKEWDKIVTALVYVERLEVE